MPYESRARGAFPVAVLQLPTYLSQELSASALPINSLLVKSSFDILQGKVLEILQKGEMT
ncbi:hypothetical protein NQZ68_006191 [Dissostichus eleginoides]|nr:hypothetical protein NQZ68_006191 [Dissostichus eleginoides]